MGLYGGYMGVIWGYMGLYGVIWGLYRGFVFFVRVGGAGEGHLSRAHERRCFGCVHLF